MNKPNRTTSLNRHAVSARAVILIEDPEVRRQADALLSEIEQCLKRIRKMKPEIERGKKKTDAMIDKLF
jgi:hypothetical protein